MVVASMTRLRTNLPVNGPLPEVEAILRRYAHQLCGEAGSATMTLRVPLDELGIPGGLALERNVVLQISTTRDDAGLNDILAIAWSPVGGGPFPSFSGTLMAWEEDERTSSIGLDGSYEPPLGAAGRLFDAAAGRRIARATALEFLGKIREVVETDPAIRRDPSRIDPEDVRRQIEEQLKRAAVFEAQLIEIEARQGTVTLKGRVGSWGERDAVARAAWAIPGVQRVENLIVVR